MNVNRRSWHARVYLWWHRHKYKSSDAPPLHANLCPYVRVVLFWAPLRFFLTNWATKWLPICTWPVLLYGVPKFLGWLSYDTKRLLWKIETLAGAVATMTFMIYAIAKYIDRDKNLFKTFGKWWDRSEERALLIAYGRAGHDRFCPEITLGSDEERRA